ncbi:MAG: DsrE family protein [Actinomycetota bacterium]|nr:MAG: DsrE family protein [Actinomycetota bacterium]
MKDEVKNSLVVVWSSCDRDIAEKMVFMYTLNSKLREWWKEVTLIIWGPSSKLISEDIELQDYLKKLKDAGVRLEACITCADMYKVSKKLAALGFEVKPMGLPLTEYLKEGRAVITF